MSENIVSMNIYDRAVEAIGTIYAFYAGVKNLQGRESPDFERLCEIVADGSEFRELYAYVFFVK